MATQFNYVREDYKMKKRIIAIVAAAVLALGCFSTASAAKYASAKKNGNAAEKKAQKLLDKGLDSKILTVADIKVANYQGATDDWEIKAFTTLIPDDYNGEAIEWIFERIAHLCAQYPKDKIVRVFNLIADDADVDDPIEITVADTDIKSTKTYALRHMDTKTGEWDATSATVTVAKAGLVKAKVTKASPFALVETKGAANNTAATGAASKTGAATGKTAAKTGEV